MATWNINVEAVEGPATSTTGNIPQWADTSGDELTDGIGTSTGGNESADGGKAVIFKPSGQVHGSCSMVAATNRPNRTITVLIDRPHMMSRA